MQLLTGRAHVLQVEMSGTAGLQATMAIVTDKGKSSKEQGNLVVKEAMAAMMHHWQAPFRYSPQEEQRSPLHCMCILQNLNMQPVKR